uniref:DUF5675 domain-containing protein n=1 Tax=viral metagenome TaxID=1070528 RepID=A0A6M3KD62_9ZZZZ
MIHVKLLRMNEDPKQTLGVWLVFDDLDLIYDCRTLELPDKGNRKNISCITAGIYDCVKRSSTKFGKHFWVTNVAGRELILVHPLNFFTQTEGCIGVGRWQADLNSDGKNDLVNSKTALSHIYSLLYDMASFKLEIIDCKLKT